jgi:hypothetical protein
MKTLAIVALSFVLAQSVCHADNSDDTLRFYLSKTDLVVLGTIMSEPMGIFHEDGVPNYICQFKVSDVCTGDAKLKGKTIKVNIKRFEMNKKDHHPLIKKDAECILFLKQESDTTIPQWATTDFWFGVQHPFPWLVKSLKRLAKQENDKVEPSN